MVDAGPVVSELFPVGNTPQYMYKKVGRPQLVIKPNEALLPCSFCVSTLRNTNSIH